MRGHNSAAFGQELSDEVETVLGDDHKKLFHYVQWHLADYISGTQGMSPEQEGIYMRFLSRLYDRGKPLPDNDKFMSTMMVLDVRRWRRIKRELVAFGKIIVLAGSLTNSRFEKERQKRAAELQKQADATRKYWEKKRAEKATSAELGSNLGPTSYAKSGELSLEVRAKVSEKSNEINDQNEHPTSYTRETRDERLEKKKDSDPNGSGAGAPEETLREMVWTKCLEWLRPRSCMNEAQLRNRIGRWVKDFGSGAVIDAVMIAQKEGPVSIMAYIEGILRRKSRTQSQGPSIMDKRETNRKKLIEIIAGDDNG